jgi:hypothetical protein
LWDATDGSSIGQPMEHKETTVVGALFNKDETRILTWSLERYGIGGDARLWNADDGTSIG